MRFASREKAILSHFEVGAGIVPGGGPMARLPRVMGRGRALEVLLSSDDIRGADAERLGYVNRALPDAELDEFVDALATRIASFHGLSQPTRGAGKNQSPPAARPPEPWRRGRSARILRRAAQGQALKSERPISLSERKQMTTDLLTI